jgi:hypothetical protein
MRSLPFSSHWTDLTGRRNFLALPVAVRCAWHALVDLAFREAAVEGDRGRLLGAATDLRFLARTLNLPPKGITGAIAAGLASVDGDDLVVVGLKAERLEAWGNESPSAGPAHLPAVRVPPSTLTPAQRAQRTEAARRGAAARWGRPVAAGLDAGAMPEHAGVDAGDMPERMPEDAGADAGEHAGAMPEHAGEHAGSGMGLGGRGEEEQEDKNTKNLEHTHSALIGIRNASAGASAGMRGDAGADAKPHAGRMPVRDAGAMPRDAGAGSASPHAGRTAEAERADARAALARFLRRQGLPAVRATPNHPDPVTEWADFLQGVIGARSKDEGLAALGAMLQEANVRGMAVSFARQVASLTTIGQAEIRRFRARAPP